jgi:DMATS type aromatic prenyltransferase
VGHGAEALPILDEVNQEIRSDSEDRAFWWAAISGTLATLLQANQYSNKAQRHYLRWFYKWVPPALGPRPISGKPYDGSWVTHDQSPFEFSINWKEKSRKQLIRFTFEPTTKQAGTASDPINQLGTKEFMNTISKDVPGLDLTRFHQFLEATNVPSDSVDDAIAKHPLNFPRGRAAVAFDLEHSSDLMVKSYFLPHWRAFQSGIPAKTIISDAIRASNGPDGLSYDGPLDAIMSYLSTFEGQEDAPLALLLANDCVADTPGMRLKVYILSEADSFTKLNEMYSLGGRLKGAHIAASLESIRKFWYHLFDLGGSGPTANDKVCVNKMKCVFVYEMRSTHGSEPDLDVKLHIPMWQLGKSDRQLSEMMASWFESHGHPDLAARYKSDLNKALYVSRFSSFLHLIVVSSSWPKS